MVSDADMAKLKEAKRLLAGAKRPVKYLHVSVQVQAPTALTPAMRTPRGKGATAVKDPQPNLGPVGRRRRANQRLMRAAREEIARGL